MEKDSKKPSPITGRKAETPKNKLSARATRDDEWQKSVRDRLLVPYYRRIAHEGQFTCLDGQDPSVLELQKRGDTIIKTKTTVKFIEEKFVRWPGYAYTSFALETKSCTNRGRQSEGWMATSKADVLAYIFVREHDALVYFIPFPELRAWFEKHQKDYRVWRATHSNRTECRIVDIRDVMAAMPQVQVRVLRESDGKRTVVSHDNKYTKGLLARALCEQGARSVDDVAEAGRSVADLVEVNGRSVDLVLYGLATARSR